MTLAFSQDGLAAVFSGNRRVRSSRGVHLRTTARRALRAYRGSRLVRHGAMAYGLADFVLATQGAHAIACTLNSRDRVDQLYAFADPGLQMECG